MKQDRAATRSDKPGGDLNTLSRYPNRDPIVKCTNSMGVARGSDRFRRWIRYDLKGEDLRSLVDCLDDRQYESLRRFLGLKLSAGIGRWSTARVGVLIFAALKDGENILNISAIARRAGASRTTVYRALSYFGKKLERGNITRTGKNRPAFYSIKHDILDWKDVSSASVHPSIKLSSSPKASQRKQKQNPPTVARNHGDALERSITTGNYNDQLHDRQKRLLCLEIRRNTDKNVASALIDELFRWGFGRGAPLGLWRDALASLPDITAIATDDGEELQWIIRRGLRLLYANQDRGEFAGILSGTATPQPSDNELAAGVSRCNARLRGLREKYDAWKAEGIRTGLCPTCGEPITRWTIEEGEHDCARWWHEKRDQLCEERAQAREQLWQRKQVASVPRQRSTGLQTFIADLAASKVVV